MPTHRIDFHVLFVRVYVLMVGLAFGLGAVIWTGQDERFSGPAFTGPRNLVGWIPGVPEWFLWGLLFVVYGLALIGALGRDSAVHILRFGMVVYGFFVVSLVTSLFPEPTAAATGVVAYSIFFLIHLTLSDHLAHTGWEG